jgi:hypothetical protein
VTEASSYPYATHLNVQFDPLELIDIQTLVEACTDQWYNQTLCRVNESIVRLGVIHGEYHWHKHDPGPGTHGHPDGRAGRRGADGRLSRRRPRPPSTPCRRSEPQLPQLDATATRPAHPLHLR